MPIEHIIYVGVTGQSVWRSKDGGETFKRSSNGMFMEAEIRALAVHPTCPETLFAGTACGLHKTVDGGDSWELLPSDLDQRQIWSLRIHPSNPDVMFAGTCPADVFRSEDAGRTWQLLDTGIPRNCTIDVPLVPRLTTLKIDPGNEARIYAGVEIAGMYRSDDGGDTWACRIEGLTNHDIHDLICLDGDTIYASTNAEAFISQDGGDEWRALNIREKLPFSYMRGCALTLSDSPKLFAGIGNGPPGDIGALARSTDHGETWEVCELPGNINSTIWNFAVNSADANLIYATSISGQLFRSEDGGNTWTKPRHEFGEVRALVWVPSD